jgi:hypothetical protein
LQSSPSQLLRFQSLLSVLPLRLHAHSELRSICARILCGLHLVRADDGDFSGLRERG